MSEPVAAVAVDTEAASDRRRLAGGAASSSAGITSLFLAGAIVSVIGARVLGPGGYGALLIVLVTSYLVPAIAGLGLAQGVAYFVGRDEWTRADLFGSLAAASAVRGIAGSAGLIGLYAAASHSLFSGVGWTVAVAVACSCPFAIAYRLGTTSALASGRLRAATVLELLPAGGMVCLVPLGSAVGGVDGAGMAVAGMHVLSGLGAMYWLRSYSNFEPAGGESGRTRGGDALLKAAGQYGIRGWLGEGLQVTNLRFDLFFINVLASTSSVAVYSIALTLAQIAWILPHGLANAVLPSAAGAHSRQDPSGSGALTATAVRHAAALALPTAAAITLLLVVGVPVLYGEQFHKTVTLGFILLPGSLLLGVARVMLAAVIASGRAIWALWIAALTVPAAVTGYLTLIPELGVEGAAISSSAAFATTGVLAGIAFWRTTGLSPRALLPTRELTGDYRALARVGRQQAGRVVSAIGRQAG